MISESPTGKQIGKRRVPREFSIIGRNLRALRRKAGMTQKDLAAILGITFQQVQKYERGGNRFPVEKLYILKNYFAVPYEEFFTGMDGEEERESMPWPDGIYLQLAGIKNPSVQDRISRVVSILME